MSSKIGDEQVIKVINIKKLKKIGFYSLVTNKETITINEDIIISYSLTKEKELSLSEYNELLKDNVKIGYFVQVCNYISFQMRSLKEVKDYLYKLKAPKKDIDKIIIRLTNMHLIDDNLLINSLFESILNNLKGPKALSTKLYQRKLKIEAPIESIYLPLKEEEVIDLAITKIIEKINNEPISVKKKKLKVTEKLIRDGFTDTLVFRKVSEISFTDENNDIIKKDIEKALYKYRNIEGKEKKNKIIIYLLSRGYSYDEISFELRNINSEE